MTTATLGKSSRMDVRLTQEQRNQIEKAAALQGMTLTQWAVSHLLDCAQRDIDQATTTRLSAGEFDAFLALLDRPMPEATQHLLAEKPIWE